MKITTFVLLVVFASSASGADCFYASARYAEVDSEFPKLHVAVDVPCKTYDLLKAKLVFTKTNSADGSKQILFGYEMKKDSCVPYQLRTLFYSYEFTELQLTAESFTGVALEPMPADVYRKKPQFAKCDPMPEPLPND